MKAMSLAWGVAVGGGLELGAEHAGRAHHRGREALETHQGRLHGLGRQRVVGADRAGEVPCVDQEVAARDADHLVLRHAVERTARGRALELRRVGERRLHRGAGHRPIRIGASIDTDEAGHRHLRANGVRDQSRTVHSAHGVCASH